MHFWRKENPISINFPKGHNSNEKKIKYWGMATRPKTLPAGLSPVLLGIALAYSSQLHFINALLTLLCTMFLQIASNVANDYYDYKNEVDGEGRLGPKRVTKAGLISPDEVKFGFIFLLILAFFTGIHLMVVGGTPILVIGILSILFAYLYTGGPFPLSYYGLGEVLAFIFFGPVAVWGTFYIQTLKYDQRVILYGFGPGFISALIMSINNLRDIESDTKTGKVTIATILGEKKARYFSLCLMVLANIIPIIAAFIEQKPFIASSCIATLVFWKNWYNILHKEIDSSFNDVLANTGKFLLLYSVLFSLGYNI